MLLRFCLLVLSLFAAGPVWAIDDPLRAQTEQFFPLPLRGGAITLDNPSGSIHIYGWYEPRVRLVALRNAYTAPRLAQVQVETETKPAELIVRTIMPPVRGFFADRSGTVDYSLNVPETAHLILRLGDGEVSVQGLRGGRAEIELRNGRIFVTNCFAQVRARSVNGAMDLLNEWWENAPATIDFALQHGRIFARLPAGAQFRVDAQTAHGRIGNGFQLKPQDTGDGQTLNAATSPTAPAAFHFRTGGGNIGIDSFR